MRNWWYTCTILSNIYFKILSEFEWFYFLLVNCLCVPLDFFCASDDSNNKWTIFTTTRSSSFRLSSLFLQEYQVWICRILHVSARKIAYGWFLDWMKWRKYTPLWFVLYVYQILIDDSDTKIANKLCFASTDPRMQTFDGQHWTAQLAGEFVLYRDKQQRIAVSFKKNLFP